MDSYYVGLMSGTSLDAIDAVLLHIEGNGGIEVVSVINTPFPDHISGLLKDMIASKTESLHELCSLDTELGEIYAAITLDLISKSGYRPGDIRAIGCHGQTVRHQPDSKYPYSLQIGNPSVIAEVSGITTVADFRARDVAAGGQGAPLVPAFHKAVFSDPDNQRVIVNIGGIANITLLPRTKSKNIVTGYDTGPGNCLLDLWSLSCRGQAFDENGNWSASGKVDEKLLDALLADSYFSKSPPKSTGTEYFNLEWLENTSPLVTKLKAEDVQTTLAELTAHSIALAIIREGYDSNEIYLCGGGVHNDDLTQRIQRHLSAADIFSTEKLGLDPDFVEATAFAWLAWRTMEKKTGNLPAVTGARHPVILGGIFLA
ncbi:MAG TPA: anhydro-N-acetylmuramic acid kinase [Gammaproteobacteria bacterium]|nr:anhydro-N-acetylmuramic acid kinase [Gammaproteobacteria bacterium]